MGDWGGGCLFQGEEDGWFGAARGLEALGLGAEMRCGLWLSSENMKSSALVISLCAVLQYVLILGLVTIRYLFVF